MVSATETFAAHVELLPGAPPEDWTGGPQGSGLLILTLLAAMPFEYCEVALREDCTGIEDWVDEVIAVALAVTLVMVEAGSWIEGGAQCVGRMVIVARLREEQVRSKETKER